MSELLTSMKYIIYIDGVEIDEFRYSMIQQVVYEDNASGSDLLAITFEDPEFLFINDDVFVVDKKVKFIGGFDNNMRTMFEGYISIIDISFPNTGSPSITLNCMDNTHLMNRVKKSRTWTNKTRGQVASEVFREYGFKTVIKETGTVISSIAQNKETDIEFLIKLADDEVEPHLVYLEGNTGYYVKKELLATPQATLDYRDGNMQILSFSPTINKETKQVETRSADVNLKDQTVDKGQANDNTDRNVQGDSVSSTDSNTQPSWVFNGSGWNKTY